MTVSETCARTTASVIMELMEDTACGTSEFAIVKIGGRIQIMQVKQEKLNLVKMQNEVNSQLSLYSTF